MPPATSLSREISSSARVEPHRVVALDAAIPARRRRVARLGTHPAAVRQTGLVALLQDHGAPWKLELASSARRERYSQLATAGARTWKAAPAMIRCPARVGCSPSQNR